MCLGRQIVGYHGRELLQFSCRTDPPCDQESSLISSEGQVALATHKYMRSAAPAISPSSAEDRCRSSWLNRLTGRVFSFPVMCLFLLMAVIFGFSVKQFAEPDIWWHLRSARDLVQTHNFVPVDTYSFTAAGTPRMNYEWLSELAYFAAFRVAGLQGILAAYFAILVLIFSGVYYRSCTSGADCKNATITTLLGISLGVVSIGPRTLLFGWLCMVMLLLILDHFRRTGKGLWLLPILFAVWINLHPSWVFGMLVLGLTFASGLLGGKWGQVVAQRWSPVEVKRLLLATVASLASMLLNPFGYKLLLYPFDFLFRQQSNVSYIEEWQGVDFSTGDGKLALLVVIALIAAALFSRRSWRLDEVLLTVFAVWMALSHSRFLFFAGLILPPILATRLDLFSPYDPEIDKPWLNAVIMVCAVAALISFFPSGAALQQNVDAQYPTLALRYMQRQQVKGNMYNSLFWGGYIEWTTSEFRPFIDGRGDIFAYKGALDDHRRILSIDESLSVLDKYQIECVLIQPQRPLAYFLEHAPGWQKIYSDNVAVLFQRSASATTYKSSSATTTTLARAWISTVRVYCRMLDMGVGA